MEGHILFQGQSVAGWVFQMLTWSLGAQSFSTININEGGGGRIGQREKLNPNIYPTKLQPLQWEALSTSQLWAFLEEWAI